MKAILTVIGKDRPGIVYRVSELLFKFNINILDFSQTIMEDKFVAMLNVDLKDANDSFENINKAVGDLSKKMGLDLKLQNEELFDNMARI